MSEKHLTELPWKTLVVKQAVKDIGLQKALVAYTKCDGTKEPEKALEALKEISELALKLKKANAAKEEVVEHLDEVVKEVKKTTPVLEARLKPSAMASVAETKASAAAKTAAKAQAAVNPSQEDEDEDEVAELKKNLKSQMISALAQVKMRAPGEPEPGKEPKPQLKFMAFLTGKSSAVVVALKVGAGTKKLLPDIAGVATGGKFVQGECIFEQNAHTFVLDAVPGGLAKKLAVALNTETGQKYKVRVRSTDGSLVLDSDTDLDPDAARVGGDPAAEWGVARQATVDALRKLATAVAAEHDTDSDKAVILLNSIIKNLTPNPNTRQSVAELLSYLRNDDVISRAEVPNPFDIPVVIRDQLLPVLERLQAQLPA